MRYLGNAFSLGMLDISEPVGLVVSPLTLEQARAWLSESSWESGVGHQDTALLMGNMLGVMVECRRISLSMKEADQLLVGQYNGPRLPEGATSLPQGATLRWYLVTR